MQRFGVASAEHHWPLLPAEHRTPADVAPSSPPCSLLPAPCPPPQSLDLLSYLCRAFLPPVFSGYFHAGALVFMFLYLWSKQNPEAQVGRGGGVGLGLGAQR